MKVDLLTKRGLTKQGVIVDAINEIANLAEKINQLTKERDYWKERALRLGPDSMEIKK